MAFEPPRSECLPSSSTRPPLKSLTINTEVNGDKYRIRKPTIQRRARNIRQNKTLYRRETLQLPSDHHHRVVRILNSLKKINHFANRSPTLRPLHSHLTSGVVELEYPQYRFWRLLNDRFMPPLTIQCVQQLCEVVIQDIRLLYAERIPYAPDLTTLEVVSKKSSEGMARLAYKPFINTFDFNVDLDDPTIAWDELEEMAIQRVRAQFSVFEVTADHPHLLLFAYFVSFQC
jgi:hypothetical protein